MYKPTQPNTWEGRTDQEDGDAGIRWHYIVQCINPEEEEIPSLDTGMKGFAFVGFRCDEGVKRNRGRAGAANGPLAIRQACMNFACHFDPSTTKLIDCGDIIYECTRLSLIQEELSQMVMRLVRKGYLPLILGGGHEVSFGGYKGAFEAFKKNRPTIGIINFDSHFDLRDPAHQFSSGTPFSQIAMLCESDKKAFNYMCMGIQPQSNTEALFRKANELGVKYILGDDMQYTNLPDIEHALITSLNKSEACYLTIDMDVFDSCDAPGVSAPAVPGIDKRIVFQLLKTILATKKVVAFDIAETNPAYDVDRKTARLAAYLIYLVVNSLQGGA